MAFGGRHGVRSPPAHTTTVMPAIWCTGAVIPDAFFILINQPKHLFQYPIKRFPEDRYNLLHSR